MRRDPHSYADDQQPQTASIDWKAQVDFATRTISATAALTFAAPAAGGPLDLDTRDLTIEEVTDGARRLEHVLHPAEPVLGARLSIQVPAGARQVVVRYRCAPNASALQWLEPAQTAGGKHPYLFSQCQAVHARSVVPLQDTPRIRVRYTAELTVPAELKSVMAAAFVGREANGPVAVDCWQMPQPIPPYLFAFAVGNLASRELGPRSRVWAEPEEVERAAREFDGVDAMIRAAEGLFGPYDWERFDLLSMPPSFPYGGMENPRLTFLTPTVIAGDKSLVNVVAHELAHSWTGNLVSNANAEHFWLNEGFTVYAERRILEAIAGREVSELNAALGRRSLDEAVARFSKQPELTKLVTKLDGVDPDEAYSQVPYEKGYLFLRAIEEAVGRGPFDAFLRKYIERYRFQSITTDDFLKVLGEALPEAAKKVRLDEWLHGTGVPADAPRAKSKKLEEIAALGAGAPSAEAAKRWTPAEWQLYLESIARPQPREQLEKLDAAFGLTASENYEVLVSWLTLAAVSGHSPALQRVDEVLGKVGRMKFLRPLYLALARTPETKHRARAAFDRFARGYHPIARQVIEGVLKQAGA